MLWAGDACVSCCGQQILGSPLPPPFNRQEHDKGVSWQVTLWDVPKPHVLQERKGLHSLPHKMLLHQGEGRRVCTPEGRAGTLRGQQLLRLAASGKMYLCLDPGTH